LTEFINLTTYVILPQTPNIRSEINEQFKEVISELNGFGFYNLPNLSMGLFTEPDRLEQVTQSFRESLTASSEIEVDKAIESLFYWLAYSQNNQIPELPSDLIDNLVVRVCIRRQPGLYSAIKWMSNITSKMPDLLTQDHLTSIELGLKYLLLEIKFPSFENLEMTLQNNPLIPVLERREYRQLSSRLAHYLYRLYVQKGKKIPAILVEWKSISEKDVLPEVRKVWQ
jgi:hypothetical protein